MPHGRARRELFGSISKASRFCYFSVALFRPALLEFASYFAGPVARAALLCLYETDEPPMNGATPFCWPSGSSVFLGPVNRRN
jgi:hypothetical protein